MRAASPISTCCACRRCPTTSRSCAGPAARTSWQSSRSSCPATRRSRASRSTFRTGMAGASARQHGAVALPRRTGPALDAAVGGGPHQEHAARPHRSGGDGAVRAAARDDRPSRILVATGCGAPRSRVSARASQRLCPRRESPRAGPRHLRHPTDRALRHPHRRLQHEAGGPDEASPIGASSRPARPPSSMRWETLHRDAPHPPSFCLFDQTHGGPHCCDFVFVTAGPAAAGEARLLRHDDEGLGPPAGAGRARRSLNPQRGTIVPTTRCTALLQ